MADMPVCVVVNGPSAVGKSTLVSSIQDRATVPLLRFGVDELYRMVPDQWAGGVADARYGDRGFRYKDVVDVPGARTIVNGVDAVAMLLAMNAAIVAMLEEGTSIIVDGQAFEPKVNLDLERRLRRIQAQGSARVATVELVADPRQLTERQARHPRPAGLALAQNLLERQSPDPDLVVRTSSLSAAEVADFVWDRLQAYLPDLSAGR